jgi:NAD(P)-dependent dehydrogenase (short-subunit alcohol dehydrogenase family)
VSDPNILGIAGRNALVVGGGFGIGRETALLLARAGVDVAVADLDEARAESVADEVTGLGVRAAAIAADVTDRARAERLVADADAALGGLDIVTNIVGLSAFADLLAVDDTLWDDQFTLNLRHHLYIGRAAARLMIDREVAGAMAFVASVSGIYGAPYHGAYGAAKAGLMSLVRTMSQEWGAYGIRVNAVAPDIIATPRVAAGFAERGADQSELGQDASLQRLGEPTEVAGALVFLVSELAGFVTGQTLIVDGGVHAAMPHKMTPFK